MNNSFNDITNEEFDSILYDLATVEEMLSVGDIYCEAKEYYNNDVLEEWAKRNGRNLEDGSVINEDEEE